MKKWILKLAKLKSLIFLASNSIYAFSKESESTVNPISNPALTLTPMDSVLPMLLGLASILLVIFVLAFLFKKFTNFGLTSKNIKVVETHPIGAREKLMIVQVRGQEFLIGVTRNSINQLGELGSDAAVASLAIESEKQQSKTIEPKTIQTSFANIFSNLIKPKSDQINSPLESTK